MKVCCRRYGERHGETARLSQVRGFANPSVVARCVTMVARRP